MMVRTRFAPSPTGFLHVGGARTALFSWLYAKHHNGKFILRIEDTDRERSTAKSVQAIIDSMNWLGLGYDEGPLYQTNNYLRYQVMAEKLLAEGSAYHCNCSKERLEELRTLQLAAKEKPRYDGHCRDKNLSDEPGSSVVRFKNPQTGVVSFTDSVYGEIDVNNQELDDLILMRSDGNPTYNFAVVIDDWDAQITHVIRGDDHINNTPRQINLFKAFNAPIPVFAHLPMILGDDGKRLSKRHGAVGVMKFQEQGFLPHALLNYLVRLGWSHGDQELFSMDEMIAAFDLQHVSRGVSHFNYDKLSWLNQHYQKTDAPDSLVEQLAWQFSKQGVDISQGPALVDLIAVQAERCKTLLEMSQISNYFYQDTIEYDSVALQKHLNHAVLAPLTALYQQLSNLLVWSRESLHDCIHNISAEFNINMGKIAQPLRVAVTGSSSSPSIDITLTLIGKTRVLSRLKHVLGLINEVR